MQSALTEQATWIGCCSAAITAIAANFRFGSTASVNSSFGRLVTASSVFRSANFLRAATSSALSLLVIPGTRVKRCRPS